MSIIFGPIPSRRLGRSLGINNIPYKHCTYSCVYCQLGSTNKMTNTIRSFFSPGEIYEKTKNRINELKSANEKIDYLTIVPDGEPTLDINLGVLIEKLKTLDIKVAVITNSSLLFDRDIKNILKLADWVSLKIDTADTYIWEKTNRPHGLLELPRIIEGMIEFASEFEGELVTETMLVKDLNDSVESLHKTAGIIKKINPQKAFILVPTRPPAKSDVEAPSEEVLNTAYQIFRDKLKNIELLAHNEGTDFSYSSDVEKELLSILAVHPMRKDAVEEFIKKANRNNGLISSLIESEVIKEVHYNNNMYYIKNIKR